MPTAIVPEVNAAATTQHRTDQERDFLPTLLAITDSPPPKLPRMILLSVLALVAILLLWSVLGRLDVVATAEGRLVPQSKLKIVQPADAGIVTEILVREGESVEAGQVMMRLDPRILAADRHAVGSEHAQLRLQLRRIDAELAGAPIPREPDDPPELFLQVSRQGNAHRQAYLDAVAAERAMSDKVSHDLQAAAELLTKLESTVPIAHRSADAYAKLQREGFISGIAADDKQREFLEKSQDLRAQQATVASLRDMLANSLRKLAQLSSVYRSDLLAERAGIDAQLRRLTGEKTKLEHKNDWLQLRAPQAGIVKDLSTHTIGTVVAPGTVLMSLVPLNEPLRAEVMLKNEDAGFVHLGQRVKLKFAAYPFQKYGMIDGEIDHIGPDVSDPQTGGRDGLDPAQTFARYPIWVKLSQQTLVLDNQRLNLTPGMQLVADIHQGQRSVLEYLLSPIQRAWMEAARER